MTTAVQKRKAGVDRRVGEAAGLLNQLLTAVREPCSRSLDRVQAILVRAQLRSQSPDDRDLFSLAAPSDPSDEVLAIIERAKRRKPARHFEKSVL